MKKKRKSYHSSLAGEFAVLSRLALFGYDANLTLGNTKGVDILASDPRSGNAIKIEVKTKVTERKKDFITRQDFGRNFAEWPMNLKHEKHNNIADRNLFYCFVIMNINTKEHRFFIVHSAIVSSYVKRQHAHWLKNHEGSETDMRMFRIKDKNDKTPIKTPLINEHEESEQRWKKVFSSAI